MALYGSVVTDRGRALIAKLIAGQTLNISRVMVGKGQMASTATREDAAAMNDLITPVAQATTTIPTVTNGVAHFTVQFSSAMNGGLQTGFWLSELGVYAYDPDDGEILLLYGTLGSYRQYVAKYTDGEAPDVRNFEINIAIGDDIGITVDFDCEAWMTAQEVSEYCEITLLPLLLDEAAGLIAAHNVSDIAHEDIRALIASLTARVRLLELINGMGSSTNQFAVTFETLDGLSVTGVWNDQAAQIEF